MRDRVAEHRENAVCARCHKVMDPIGFALENFDAVGRWRVKDGDAKIDATDVVFDGTKVEGAGLRNFLMSRKEVFVQTLAEKLLMYALGRTPEYYDMPAVRRILRDASRNDDRRPSIVLGIVLSTPFQMRMKTAQPAEAADGAGGSLKLAALNGQGRSAARKGGGREEALPHLRYDRSNN
jgi:hypothetical protein